MGGSQLFSWVALSIHFRICSDVSSSHKKTVKPLNLLVTPLRTSVTLKNSLYSGGVVCTSAGTFVVADMTGVVGVAVVSSIAVSGSFKMLLIVGDKVGYPVGYVGAGVSSSGSVQELEEAEGLGVTYCVRARVGVIVLKGVVGSKVGLSVGSTVGVAVGASVGSFVGLDVLTRFVGINVGFSVGTKVGN